MYNPATNSWTVSPSNSIGFDETSWVLMPDGSVVNCQGFKYLPTQNTFVSTGPLPFSLETSKINGVNEGEFGAALLLPDGRAFFIGAPGRRPITRRGRRRRIREAGKPARVCPTACLPMTLPPPSCPTATYCSKARQTARETTLGPVEFFDFDPSTNTYTAIPNPAGGTDTGWTTGDRMLVLPTGQVFWSGAEGNYVFTPATGPNIAWQPTIANVSSNADGSYHLTGTLLDGVSLGAGYGDDVQEASNYPLVQLTSTSGNVYYTSTFNWAPGEVGDQGLMATDFTLPVGLPNGTYSLRVVADGIASNPMSVLVPSSFTDSFSQTDSASTFTSAGYTLPSSTITVMDATNFTSTGQLAIQTTGGLYTVASYTGISGSTFTGVSGGSGIVNSGACVYQLGLGSNWAVVPSTAVEANPPPSTFILSGNQAVPLNTGLDALNRAAIASTASADESVSAQVTITTTSFGYGAVYARMGNGNNQAYVGALFTTGNGGVKAVLGIATNDSIKGLVPSTILVPGGGSAPYTGTLTLDVFGSSLSLFLDTGSGQVLVASATNTVLTAPGGTGILDLGGISAFQNFL